MMEEEHEAADRNFIGAWCTF